MIFTASILCHSLDSAFSAHCFLLSWSFLLLLDIAPLDSPPPIPTWSGTVFLLVSPIQVLFFLLSFLSILSYLSLLPLYFYLSFVIRVFVLR